MGQQSQQLQPCTPVSCGVCQTL